MQYAKEKVNIKRINLKFVEAGILNLSNVFKNQHFDIICHKGVMEHFCDKDIVKGMIEQRKISREVIFHVPNNRSKLTDKCYGDERLLSNKKWIKLIKEAGFSNIKVFGDYYLHRYIYLLPGVFFRLKLSFWWKYSSKHSIFICE